ncbi:MAG: DEAD/DEAH box helicase [Candidatus Riflebacteria bacterium]|nr:DEAD/DEAH box helicase [Candidatus Riflebacteria bacterium]
MTANREPSTPPGLLAKPESDRALERAILASLRRCGPAFFGRFGRLTPIQRTAIPRLLAGESAVVAAPTAGGKTEAVAAPLAELHLARADAGAALLWVCPTRALVNDLYRRLAPPLERLGIVLGRKTADHPVSRQGRLSPWLITTPESFDSLLVRRPGELVGVRAVVLDEIHLVDGTPRGDQLGILMSRVRRIHRAAVDRGDRDPRSTLQTVLVSATAADPASLAAAFAPGAGVLRVAGSRTIETIGAPLAGGGTVLQALRRIPRSGAAKLLVFTRSRAGCEEVAAELAGQAPWGHHVYAHHGSLSRSTRLAAEEAFHRAAQAVFVATSTLELGIDIGDVDWVVQVGAPPSVTSFLQQIGRGCRRRKDVTRVLGVARGRADEVMFEVILSLARKGEIERPGRIFAASVLVQQIASYLLQRSSGTVGRPEIEALLADPDGVVDPAGPALHLQAVLVAMTEQGLLTVARGGRYGIGPTLERWFETDPRKLHTNMGQVRDTVAVFDAGTHEHLGDVQRSGIPAAGPVAFAGRTGHLTTTADGRAYLDRSGPGPAQAPRYFTAPMPISLGLAQAVREHLGIPVGVVPVIPAGPGRIAVFPFLGGAGTRALAAHLAGSGLRIRAAGDASITLDAAPSPAALRLDPRTLERAVATCWKRLERLQEPGAHARLVPIDIRRRQVVERLLATGVVEVAATFSEVRELAGPEADLLAAFLV